MAFMPRPWWLLLALALTLALALARATPASASVCSTLPPTLSMCTIDSNCQNGGKCHRGACKCAAGYIGFQCQSQAASTFQNLGVVAVTQAAFDEAPQTFSSSIVSAWDEAVTGTPTLSSAYPSCTPTPSGSYYVYVYPITQAMVSQATLEPTSVAFNVVSGGVTVQGTAYVVLTGVDLDFYGGLGCCPGWGGLLCPEVCLKADGDNMDMEFNVGITANIQLTYSSSLNGIVPTVSNVSLDLYPSDLGATLNCPSSNGNIIRCVASRAARTELPPTHPPPAT